jgi:hypothetical protein
MYQKRVHCAGGTKEQPVSLLCIMSVVKQNENFSGCGVTSVLIILAGPLFRLPEMSEYHDQSWIKSGI